MFKSLYLPSFAKINWRLQVLGRRLDGFHELFTVFQTVSMSDTLSFEASDHAKVSFECSDSELPTDEGNLVVRAAQALRERFQVARGARIRLEKQIPPGGGLGGGSSNAAITLLGLSWLWDIQPTFDELLELARPLGADVPFFLTGGTAAATGIGDILEPLPDVECVHLIIATPGVKVSSAEAYKRLNAPALTKEYTDIMLSVCKAEAEIPWFSLERLRNDFESAVFGFEPEVKRVKEALMRVGAREALMSGSGSSVFAIFDNREAQMLAFSELKREVGWRVILCSTTSREDYVKALGPCAAFLQSSHRD